MTISRSSTLNTNLDSWMDEGVGGDYEADVSKAEQDFTTIQHNIPFDDDIPF